MDIFLDQEIIYRQNLSSHSIAVYSILRMIMTKEQKTYYITSKMINYYLTENDTCKCNRRMLDYIGSGIAELIDNKIIAGRFKNGKDYILDLSNIILDTGVSHYIIINLEELQQIMNMNEGNKFKILRYFIYLTGTISSTIEVWLDAHTFKSRVVSTLSIDFMVSKFGMSKGSIIDYNELLENANLIYIHRQEDFIVDSNGALRSLENVYGRYKDKEYVIAYATDTQKYKKSYKFVKSTKGKANYNRKLAQEYYNMNHSGKNYPVDEIRKINEYVIRENRKYQQMYEKDGYSPHLDKIRDVKVFQRFNLPNMVE